MALPPQQSAREALLAERAALQAEIAQHEAAQSPDTASPPPASGDTASLSFTRTPPPADQPPASQAAPTAAPRAAAMVTQPYTPGGFDPISPLDEPKPPTREQAEALRRDNEQMTASAPYGALKAVGGLWTGPLDALKLALNSAAEGDFATAAMHAAPLVAAFHPAGRMLLGMHGVGQGLADVAKAKTNADVAESLTNVGLSGLMAAEGAGSTAKSRATAATPEIQADASAGAGGPNPAATVPLAAPGAPAAAAAPVAASADPQAIRAMGTMVADAAQNPTGSAAARLASQAKPDPEAIAAAKRLGVLDQLDVDHVSSNPTLQRATQAIPGSAERNARALKALGDSLDQLLKKAGAQVNQGVVDATAKEAIQKQIDTAESLKDGLYKQVFGERGIGGLVPGDKPAPIKNFISEIERIKLQSKGVLPKDIQKVVKDLVPTGEDSTPTVSMVDRIRKLLGAAVKGKGVYGKKLQATGEAHALFKALDADQLAVAEQYKAGTKFREAQEAYKAHADMVKQTVAVLGKEGERSLAGQVRDQASALPHLAPDGFERVVRVTPEPLRPDLVRSSLYQFIENRQLDLKAFRDWYSALIQNSKSYNSFMAYAGQEVRTALQDVYKVATNIDDAVSRSGANFKDTFQQKTTWIGLVKNLFKLGAVNAAPGPEMFKWFLMDKIFHPGTALAEDLGSFITSPAGRIAIDHSATGTPLPAGRLASIVASPTFQRLMDAANVPFSERYRWLEKGIAAGAVSSPARAGVTQQPEEGK